MKTILGLLIVGFAFLTLAADPPPVPDTVVLRNYARLNFDTYGTVWTTG